MDSIAWNIELGVRNRGRLYGHLNNRRASVQQTGSCPAGLVAVHFADAEQGQHEEAQADSQPSFHQMPACRRVYQASLPMKHRKRASLLHSGALGTSKQDLPAAQVTGRQRVHEKPGLLESTLPSVCGRRH